MIISQLISLNLHETPLSGEVVIFSVASFKNMGKNVAYILYDNSILTLVFPVET